MSKVIRYANNNYLCYCQIKLDSGERILINIATAPTPSTKIQKLVFRGLLPIQTIWEYNPTMAGGYEHYVRKMMAMFVDPLPTEGKKPLDILRDFLLPCKSISEVRDCLLEAESKLSK